MILHIKVMDGELNAAPRGCVNVPDTLLVGGVPVRVAGATEGARVPRQLSATTCEKSKAQSVPRGHRPLGKSQKSSYAKHNSKCTMPSLGEKL